MIAYKAAPSRKKCVNHGVRASTGCTCPFVSLGIKVFLRLRYLRVGSQRGTTPYNIGHHRLESKTFRGNTQLDVSKTSGHTDFGLDIQS